MGMEGCRVGTLSDGNVQSRSCNPVTVTMKSLQKLVMKHMNDFQSGAYETGTHKQLCIVYYIYNYLQSLTNEIRYK